MTIMKRRARSCFAFVAMLGLLFAQLSLTAYACRMLDGEAATPVVAAVPMTDCADMAAAQANANLCEVHCQDGIKSTLATTGDVPPTVVLSFISSSFATNPPLRGRLACRARCAGCGTPAADSLLPFSDLTCAFA